LNSWAQVIFLPQPPEQLVLQEEATVPSLRSGYYSYLNFLLAFNFQTLAQWLSRKSVRT
jgi:hypothetical protein